MLFLMLRRPPRSTLSPYTPLVRAALEQTVAGAEADVVVIATPCDLGRLIGIAQPVVRARYDYADMEGSTVAGLVDRFLDGRGA